MRPHVDETEGKEPTGDLLKQRDLAIKKLAAVVKRDKVWQVRSAAAFGLATMRERADAIGASLDLISSPGKGTRIELTLELPDGHPVP